MKLGITGLPGAGKTTAFEALTLNFADGANRGEPRIGTVHVPDERVDRLSEMYRPRKTIYAQVAYFLPALTGQAKDKGPDPNAWTAVRDCDALIHVVRNFGGYGFDAPDPAGDFAALDGELVFSDLVVVEKRLERLDLDRKRGKDIDPEERRLLEVCRDHLENERPIRKDPELANARPLRGFALLSAKPMLALVNNEDDDDDLPPTDRLPEGEECMVIKAKLEQELAQMTDAEAGDFLAEFNITASAKDRVIRRSYDLLGLISFFTVGDDEVRAWTVHRGIDAQEAAGTIHTDLKKGFIRAEVVAYDDLMAAGGHAEARKQGTVRLEGKTYTVQDGDIMNIRFNV